MFIDESGDHNLDPKKVDDSYPIFVLAGCIFDVDYYRSVAIPEVNHLKESFFGGTDIIFHTAEMVRPLRSRERRYAALVDKDFRIKFYSAINDLLSGLDFKLVACVIHKKDHWDRYGLAAADPYLLSFDNLLNRFIFQMKYPDSGEIIAEKRDPVLDNQLELTWLKSKVSGTDLVRGIEISKKIDEFRTIPKSRNEIGLQITDLVVSAIGRHILGLREKPGHEVSFSVLEKKFISRNSSYLKCGLTILPRPK